MKNDPIFQSGQPEQISQNWVELGFKFGEKGAHTSRTIMVDELTALLRHCPSSSTRSDYVHAVVEENCLGKHTLSTRQLTVQRLSELYSLDPKVLLFHLLRHYWDADEKSQPQLAILTALARDPLLRVTAPAVIAMKEGEEIARQRLTDALREALNGRLNDDSLDKVVRNTASSWTQSGHLEGRSRKKRLKLQPTPVSTAYALLLGFLLGNRDRSLFETLFCRILDRNIAELTFLAMDAKRLGFLDIKMAGGLIVVSFDMILTEQEKRLVYGTH